MTQETLLKNIKAKQSYLCVGLDIDLEKVPEFIRNTEDPLFTFAKAIIDKTHSYAVAYKPNLAFFESYGVDGWRAFDKIMRYLNENYPEHFTIADAKRGDIGNTAARYAKAFFENYGVDAVTVAPYMGKDAVEPFLTFKDKYAILLSLTSNPGAFDFQFTEENGKKLFEKVLQTSLKWNGAAQLMYVVGATKASALTSIRQIIPEAFLLVPGVGAQGGSLKEVSEFGMNESCGLLVNSSRGIIYASHEENFADAAASEAKKIQQEMAGYLLKKGII
ncbi:orotidine-5'-phosphate decarboxylase [Flavobacteriaceae bacterium]|jgi:orotidine-5'-phosphate decarboxylase|nr:orotidine-5'-phosphate decarboxylase [Flavobacteriaceae bacterium]MDC0386850.1 orotidine-5'-phosphate decarboxylase [Flavobacteriaceae bacterium]